MVIVQTNSDMCETTYLAASFVDVLPSGAWEGGTNQWLLYKQTMVYVKPPSMQPGC